MQSVKFCNRSLTVQPDASCANPDVTQFVLIQPDLYNAQPGLVASNAVTTVQSNRGIVFGGLTADIIWSHDPFEDNIQETRTGFLKVWEAIHVMSSDELGFATYIPNLSREGVGADQDVDLLWKRLSFIPIYMTGNDCGAGGCQLALIQQGNPDHIRVKSRRRLNEHQLLVYSTSLVLTGGLSDLFTGVPLRFDAWFRIAARLM